MCWLPRNEEFNWVYKRLWSIMQQANKDYLFDISMFIDDIQISMYDESEQGFYTWHIDHDYNKMIRKLSISIPLNNTTEYEGGDLLFNPYGEVRNEIQISGRAIVFPSFVLHTVTPVTKGRRYSLVAWVGGPPFQ